MRKFALAVAVFVTLGAHPQQQPGQTSTQPPTQPQPPKPQPGPQQPQLKPVVRETAPLQRDLPDDGKVSIPVDLEDPAATVAVREITRGGKQLDRSIVSASFAPDDGQHLLNVTIVPAQTADAGVYTLQLRVTPSDPKAFTASTLTLALTRPAAKLDVLSPIRIERTVMAPGWVRYEPSRFAIREGGESDAVIRPRTWMVDAASDERKPYALVIREVTPKDKAATNRITRGGGLLVEPDDDGLPLGLVTGTMSIESPQLAAPVPVTLEVRSRLALGYLVFMIVAGVLFGWLLRVHLERKRAVAAAQAAGVPLWEQLLELQRTTHEASLQRELDTIVTPLFRAWQGKSAEAITQAVTNARAALEPLLKKIAEKKKTVADQVNALRAAIGGPERQSGGLRTYVREVGKDIQRIEDDLKAGRLERAAERAETLNGALAARLEAPLASWRRNVEDLRTSLTRWKEVKLPDIPDIGPLADKTAVAVTTKMSEAAAATSTLNALTESVARAAESLANQAAAGAPAATALELRNGVRDVRNARETFFEEPAAVIVPLDALRTLLDRVKPPAEDDEREAADAGRSKTSALTLPRVPYVEVRVDAPKVAISGQPMRFHADVTIDGEPATNVMLAWSVNGQHAFLGRPGELTFSHTPLSTDQFRVGAEVLGEGQQNARSAEVVVTPAAAHLFDPVALETSREKAVAWQTWLAAIPIVAIGAVIFRKTWIGTPDDWATVFLWGFSTDIGVNKLLDLAKPLTKYAPAYTPAPTAPDAGGAAQEDATPTPPADEEKAAKEKEAKEKEAKEKEAKEKEAKEKEAKEKEGQKPKPAAPPEAEPSEPAEPEG